MGIGERQQESDVKALEEGSLKPLTNKDPKKAADNPIQGIWQKLKSAEVILLRLLVGVLVVVVIIFATLYGTASTGNDKNTAYLEATTAEKLSMPTKRLVTKGAQCEDGWILMRGKCYFLSDNKDTWTNSQKFCELHKSSLAKIDNHLEYIFLNRIKGESNHWIGLSRTEDDSGWVWADRTPYSEDLFQIERMSVDRGELEGAFLNHKDVKSGSEKFVKKWICRKLA